MTLNLPSQLSAADALTCQVVHEAPLRAVAAAGCDPEYADLCRWFLWDKVGCALRGTDARSFSPSKAGVVAEQPVLQLATPPTPWQAFRQRLQSFRRGVPAIEPSMAAPSFLRRNSLPLLYVPVLSPRLKGALAVLARRGGGQIVVQHNHGGMAGLDLYRPQLACNQDVEVATAIHAGLIGALEQFGVILPEQDAARLFSQVLGLTKQAQVARRELEELQPDAVLVHGDNHPPFQAYVLAARQLGIPSVMLQHGLDCEHYFLDEAYASEIAVWGEARARRYRQTSRWQPGIRVTGNPEYDEFRLPPRIDRHGDYWLWLTRPHVPGKCYLPSRQPEEGIEIFAALAAALKRTPGATLVIKPHPYDYAERYESEIERHDLRNRVSIAGEGVMPLLSRATVVVSEDSTAGMEAMFAGKPLVHAHFCGLPPTLPLVEFSAALPGFSPEQLQDSLDRVPRLTASEQERMAGGQRAFLEDYAGVCDGLAGSRVAEYLENILKR